ncbi:ClpXP protease specificity-enhancing factor [Halomonas sp. G15]|uniref:ClpXP protease specificity-enhancing factor n=1 Tax=Halomonas alimentaria TaxID=147248 RepID=A0A7X5AQQ8_9GAMM|nr:MULTISPECIES: ClpXP protease specificity-enhancing factor [Halomonas]MCE0731416.1 ClpXP protease specificity-enhancing factor [Halomonas sp. G15]NAW35163.1 ClpXP protease specificity-enhancing factor [Halomonas alimentaria]
MDSSRPNLSSRPYLARALFQWLLDNDLTPHIVVDAEHPDVEVPRQFVQNGQIVLNLSPTAVRDLAMENDAISFGARFGGQPMRVMVPSDALVAIYGRENGVGMVFGHEPVMPQPADAADEEAPTLTEVESDGDASAGEEPPAEEGEGNRRPPKGRPSLRVIK